MRIFTPKQRKQVALLIETSNQYARGLLLGINRYLQEHPDWSVYLGEISRNNQDMSWLSDWHGDGILARIETDETADYIMNSGLPAIDLSASRKLPGLTCVETNDQAIAVMAADHFLENGFQHFAYYGDNRFQWSIHRDQHYRSYLGAKGFDCLSFKAASDNAQQGASWENHINELVRWLKQLPKPVGIMCCYDIRGQQLLEACRLAEIDVPDEVAVIGVDNDELLCDLSTPRLSSIQTNPQQAGYLAAQLLDRQIAGERIGSEIHLIDPLQLQVRMSSDVLAVEDKTVSEAIRFIRQHAHENIQVQDILNHIPVTRRVLESRFLKALGRTPHEQIISIKLKMVKQLLEETELSLADIAERTGFKHTEYMSVVFNREFHIRPGQYRKERMLSMPMKS
ncbi:AraC family transcriptional regulator [Paenibacillus sp. IITD108]|uniref:AraC family transcriptional regulator n=1 Tax=Paenibacillus sp. IITD108 TaxID=3116649 RepID=UPI002F3ED8C0